MIFNSTFPNIPVKYLMLALFYFAPMNKNIPQKLTGEISVSVYTVKTTYKRMDQITSVTGKLAEKSRHELDARVVQGEVQSVAAQTELRVRGILPRDVNGLRVRAAGRDKQLFCY